MKNLTTYLSINNIIDDVKIWQPPFISNNFETKNCRGEVKCDIKYNQLISMYEDLGLTKFDDEIITFSHIPNKPKYTLLLSAGMNGCELPGIFGLYYFIKFMLNSDEDGMQWIKNNCTIYIIPCISQYSFDNCTYSNINGVNINRNFDYHNSWYAAMSNKDTWSYKGEYPMSEVETKFLYSWFKSHKNADLYIDCHSNVTMKNHNKLERTFEAIVSNNYIKSKVIGVQEKLYNIYNRKNWSPTKPYAYIPEPTSYPKIFICQNEFNIPNIMIEQHSADKGHNGNGNVCSNADLKNYITLLRAYILSCINKKG